MLRLLRLRRALDEYVVDGIESTLPLFRALVREQDGCRQFIVVGNQAEASTLQCGSYAEAEIIRRAKA